MTNDPSTAIGFGGLLSIVVTLLSIYLAWVLLQQLKLDAVLKNPKSPAAKILLLMLAVITGHSFARFLLDYWNWSQMLHWLFA